MNLSKRTSQRIRSRTEDRLDKDRDNPKSDFLHDVRVFNTKSPYPVFHVDYKVQDF